MKSWSTPVITIEEFEANEYVSTCLRFKYTCDIDYSNKHKGLLSWSFDHNESKKGCTDIQNGTWNTNTQGDLETNFGIKKYSSWLQNHFATYNSIDKDTIVNDKSLKS